MRSCTLISSITLVKSRDVVTRRLCLFLLALLLATVQSAVVNGQSRKPVAASAASSTALLHTDSLKKAAAVQRAETAQAFASVQLMSMRIKSVNEYLSKREK